MHAELRHPSALIAHRAKRRRLQPRCGTNEGSGHASGSRIKLRIGYVETEIGLAVDIELGPATHNPVAPVVVAGPNSAGHEGGCLDPAQRRVSSAVVAGRGIGAVD